MRGGGTSQAGQAIGAGLSVDTSKYFNRLLEVNAAERWARVEPGIVLDELNAALRAARPALRAGYLHGQPRHARRHDGQQLQRRALGALRQDDRPRARAARRALGRLASRASGRSTPAELEAICRRRLARSGLLPRGAPAGARLRRAKSSGAIPKILRRVGGYNLDCVRRSATRPFNLAKLMVGSEGTLGVVLEAKVKLVPLPKAKAVLAIQFADLLDALEATPAILAHQPSAVEVMDRFILDNTKQSAALDRLRQTFIEGDPGALLCVEFYADRARGPAAAARRARARSAARATSAIAIIARSTPAAQAPIWSAARSGARPVDGDEGRRQVALVRRGHRRRAGEAARLHRPVPRDRRAGTARPPASTRTRRSAACTSGRWST